MLLFVLSVLAVASVDENFYLVNTHAPHSVNNITPITTCNPNDNPIPHNVPVVASHAFLKFRRR